MIIGEKGGDVPIIVHDEGIGSMMRVSGGEVLQGIGQSISLCSATVRRGDNRIDGMFWPGVFLEL